MAGAGAGAGAGVALATVWGFVSGAGLELTVGAGGVGRVGEEDEG